MIPKPDRSQAGSAVDEWWRIRSKWAVLKVCVTRGNAVAVRVKFGYSSLVVGATDLESTRANIRRGLKVEEKQQTKLRVEAPEEGRVRVRGSEGTAQRQMRQPQCIVPLPKR